MKVDIAAELHRTATNMHEKYVYYLAHATLFAQVAQGFEKFDVNHTSAYADSLYVAFTGTAQDLKDAAQMLRDLGFKPDVVAIDGSPKATFTNTFRSPGGAVVLLNFSSSECTLVKVGTKMVEQPVYEVQCDGKTVPNPIPLTAEQLQDLAILTPNHPLAAASPVAGHPLPEDSPEPDDIQLA